MSRSSGLRRLLVLDLVNDDRLELGVDLERMRVVFRDRQLHLTLLLLTAIDQEGAEDHLETKGTFFPPDRALCPKFLVMWRNVSDRPPEGTSTGENVLL